MGPRLKKPLVGSVLFLATIQVGAVDLPKPFEAVYTLQRSGFTAGEVRLDLTRLSETRYRYRRSSRTTGLVNMISPQSIDESSELEVVDGQVRPTRYHYHRQGKRNRLVQIHFDWEKKVATNLVDGDRWKMSVPAGTWDKLAVELAVVMDLINSGKTGTYPVADGGKLKQYQFEQLATENRQTDAGTFETKVIKRKREKDAKRSTTLWMAPALNYAPVRVVHENEGEGEGEVNLVSFKLR